MRQRRPWLNSLQPEKDAKDGGLEYEQNSNQSPVRTETSNNLRSALAQRCLTLEKISGPVL